MSMQPYKWSNEQELRDMSAELARRAEAVEQKQPVDASEIRGTQSHEPGSSAEKTLVIPHGVKRIVLEF